jgi:hypothetical protein
MRALKGEIGFLGAFFGYKYGSMLSRLKNIHTIMRTNVRVSNCVRGSEWWIFCGYNV